MTAPPTAHRDSALDVLRGVAILLVFCRHMRLPGAESSPLTIGLTAVLNRIGWAGVDLFFVLSGYLVAGLLFREFRERGEVHIGRFLIRRAFKIYPAYYVFLALTAIAAWPAVSRGGALAQLAFVQNYWPSLPAWSHTWSLAIEEHFYLLLAAAVAVGLRRRPAAPFSWVPLAAGILIVGTLALRIHVAGGPFSLAAHFLPTHLRLDGFAIGVTLSYFVHCRPAEWRAWLRRWFPNRLRLLLVSLTLLLPLLVFEVYHPVMHSVGYTVIALGFAGLLVWAKGAGIGRGIWTRWLVPVGVSSYSIYLWHKTPRAGFDLVWAALGWRPPYELELACYVGGGILMGIMMGRLVEWPALAVRDRYFPSRAQRAPSEPSLVAVMSPATSGVP